LSAKFQQTEEYLSQIQRTAGKGAIHHAVYTNTIMTMLLRTGVENRKRAMEKSFLESCKTCVRFNASYRVCDVKGEITRLLSGCDEWACRENADTVGRIRRDS